MDFFDKLSKKASETYKVTAEKTTKIAKETKLKLEISNYKSNMEDLYKIVGKKIYQKYAALHAVGILLPRCQRDVVRLY